MNLKVRRTRLHRCRLVFLPVRPRRSALFQPDFGGTQVHRGRRRQLGYAEACAREQKSLRGLFTAGILRAQMSVSRQRPGRSMLFLVSARTFAEGFALGLRYSRRIAWFTEILSHKKDGPFRTFSGYPGSHEQNMAVKCVRNQGKWFYPASETKPVSNCTSWQSLECGRCSVARQETTAKGCACDPI